MSSLILMLLMPVYLISCGALDPGGPGWFICFLLSEEACFLPCGGCDAPSRQPQSINYFLQPPPTLPK